MHVIMEQNGQDNDKDEGCRGNGEQQRVEIRRAGAGFYNPDDTLLCRRVTQPHHTNAAKLQSRK
ncbi:MAG: hypothetical protein VYA34_06495 [Myxococcota bacterium]|nr:hypothetical protein [Myxococcota bacterium]